GLPPRSRPTPRRSNDPGGLPHVPGGDGRAEHRRGARPYRCLPNPSPGTRRREVLPMTTTDTDAPPAPRRSVRRPRRPTRRVEAMTYLFFDLETRSDLDLKKSNVYRYSETPDFEILMIAWAVDHGPVKIAVGQKEIEDKFLT